MTEEEIQQLANEDFQWIDDEGEIMEGTLTSDDILEFAQKIADIAYKRGYNEAYQKRAVDSALTGTTHRMQ